MNELLLAIFKDIDSHIYKIVDRRVSEVLANYATLSAINEEFEDKIKSICKGMLDSHEDDEHHYQRSDIEEFTHEAMDNYDFSSACGEIVDDRIDSALDDILHDKIQEILNDTKFVITGGTITTEV
jgi:hypothetical protein